MNLNWAFSIFPFLYGALYVTGLIVALCRWRQSPTAYGLLLAGAGLNLTATVGRFIVQHANWLLARDDPRDLFGLILLAFGLIQWVGHALIVAAVLAGRADLTSFSRRPRLPLPDDEDDWRKPAPSPGAPGDTGIQEGKPV